MDKIMELWEKLAIEREGYENTAYHDTKGILTIGIGHKVLPEDNIKAGDFKDNEWVEKTFQNDTARFYKIAAAQALELGKTSPEFIVALMSANFQLGDFKHQFPTSFGLLKEGYWQGAVINLRNSLWAKQTPVRVQDFITAIKTTYAPSLWRRVVTKVIGA